MIQSGGSSADFFVAALRCAMVGVWRYDQETGSIALDSVAENILGLTSPCALEALLQSAAPQDRAAAAAFFRTPHRPVRRETIDFRIVRSDGETRWLQCTGCALWDGPVSGEKLGGVVRDVSARKEAELRLQESQRRLNTLIDNLQGIAYRTEAAAPWRILFVSKGVTPITGYDVAELEEGDWTWGALFHPDDLPAAAREVEQAVAERRPFRLSYRLMHRSGATRWVRECGEAVYDAHGKALFLEGFISDISDLVHSEAVLRRSKELLEAVLEGIPDGIFLKNYADEGRYAMINNALSRMMGRSAAEVIGRTDHELFPSDEASEYVAQDRLIVDKGLPGLTGEQIVATAQGQRLLEVRKVPLRNEAGESRYVLGIVRDRTEQHALEVKVQKMQRMDAVGQLTGGIAHDFNNLLAIILGYGELLRESLSDPAAIGLTDKIIEATERGGDLVRRLLVFARKQRLEPHAMNLNERLPGVVALLQRTLGENVRIELALGADLWPVRADPGQIDDALVNLAINARDAMPEGGLLTIRTENVRLDQEAAAHLLDAEPGDYVMLAVSDTGQGMKPEVLARVFEPFFTTKEQGRGTGLGLPMVYGFVQQSGGHVDIDSSPGHGTTVKLYLPRATGRATASGEDAAAPDVAGGHETILLVEDNGNVRTMATLQLRKLGYHVLEAANAADALALIEKGVKIDLLFTDIVMPGGMSGYQLAERVRQIRPDLRILFTTGYDSPAANRPPDARPGGDLLHKPYRRHELAHAIRRALDQEGPPRTSGR